MDKARVIKIVARLAQWPDVNGAKPLRGELAGHYRMRTGDYRVQFRVEGTAVIVERVRHRDGFYGDWLSQRERERMSARTRNAYREAAAAILVKAGIFTPEQATEWIEKVLFAEEWEAALLSIGAVGSIDYYLDLAREDY